MKSDVDQKRSAEPAEAGRLRILMANGAICVYEGFHMYFTPGVVKDFTVKKNREIPFT